jgi:hypothetical protein
MIETSSRVEGGTALASYASFMRWAGVPRGKSGPGVMQNVAID